MKKLIFLSVFALCCNTAWTQTKMSLPTGRFLAAQNKTIALAGTENESYVNAAIYLQPGANTEELEALGIRIGIEQPGLITARIPAHILRQVAEREEVKYLQIGTPVYRKMDKARELTMTDYVQQGFELPSPFMGENVVVGIIDSGFDYTHPNFYTSDGSELRIKRVWDQNIIDTPPAGFDYGTEYTTSEEILALGTDIPLHTHGTHVAGIAAGADRTDDNPYYGIASQADIVLVSVNMTGNSNNIEVAEAVQYIFNYAQSIGKSCVINISLGSHSGPHDGTSAFDTLADALQGEGRLIVGAVGNEGEDELHISKTFESSSSTPLKSFIRYKDNTNRVSETDIWGDAGMAFTVQAYVYDIKNKKYGTATAKLNASLESGNEEEYVLNFSKDKAAGIIYIATEINPLNQKPHAYVYTELSNIDPNCVVGFNILPLSSGTVHAWADNVYSTLDHYNMEGWTIGNADYSAGEIGGTGKRIISAGAYVSKSVYTNINGDSYTTGNKLKQKAKFSSMGPTADGRIKPDIMAPGSTISSSVSSYGATSKQNIIKQTTWKGKTYSYAVMSGTSMASPFVAGVLATWLQAYPNLTPEQVREVFKTTAMKDTYTGEIPAEGSNTWGFGKIDAWGGIKNVLKMAEESVENPASGTRLWVIGSEPGSRSFRILSGQEMQNLNVSVCSSNGQVLHQQNIDRIQAGEELTIALPQAGKGIYIVKLENRHLSKNYKVIIR